MPLPASTADLPINECLPDLLRLLESKNRAVLIAPPGAGKTTLVPLTLLDAPWREDRKIIVLEPRRLAARNAANRMAQLLGEKVGGTVGYRVRLDTKISAQTRIEVVTEGVFTRMLSADAGLENIACVLFDEFHERSLDSDLALALCLDLQDGLRDDLRLVPMSATLDGGGVSSIINAQVIESAGRQFPVEITYREGKPRESVEAQVASAVRDELMKSDGSILCFLPGQREIERSFDLLDGKLLNGVALHRLYGALPTSQQDAALKPNGRKVVLASAIAETSLTIDGISTVIDSGLSRHPVYEPATGLTRLQTVRTDQAAITQRAGRAGRLGPGKAVRLWREQQTAALPKAAVPEILNADLSNLVLDLADWGVSDPSALTWLNPPPTPAWNEARNLLETMGALSGGGLTDHGRALAKLPLPPRLAHMVLTSGEGALLALISQERGVGGNSINLETRLQNAQRGKDRRFVQLRKLADRISKQANASGGNESVGVMLARAYPDRIGKRSGQSQNGMVRYTLANGRGCEIDAGEELATHEFIVVADMIGRAGSARIVVAAPIAKSELLENFADLIKPVRDTRFDTKSGKLIGEETRNIGSVKLEKPTRFEPQAQDIENAMLDAVMRGGLKVLPWQKADNAVLGKLLFLESHGEALPASFDETTLLETLEDWLAPFLGGKTALSALGDGTLSQALLMRADLSARDLEQLLPSQFTVPSGSSVPIRYEADKAVMAVRPQEMFGLDVHPSIMGGRLPLELELTSPAGRPIQITRDLPGFWRGSWADVRADLRGRYPKHPWPEDPLSEPPTRRVKPRKS